jgi:hypothetical protein
LAIPVHLVRFSDKAGQINDEGFFDVANSCLIQSKRVGSNRDYELNLKAGNDF